MLIKQTILLLLLNRSKEFISPLKAFITDAIVCKKAFRINLNVNFSKNSLHANYFWPIFVRMRNKQK